MLAHLNYDQGLQSYASLLFRYFFKLILQKIAAVSGWKILAGNSSLLGTRDALCDCNDHMQHVVILAFF